MSSKTGSEVEKALEHLVVELMLLAVTARSVTVSRAPVMARPRRGSDDLGDRDRTPQRARERDVVEVPVRETERWLMGAAWAALVLTAGFAVRGAFALV